MSAPPRIPEVLRILVTLASFVVIVAGMSIARSILVPVLFAAFLAIICGPAMGWLVRRRVPRPFALLLVFLAMGAIGATVVLMIGQSVYSFRDNLETFKEPLQQKVATITETLTRAGIEVPTKVQADSLNTDHAVDYLGQLLGGLTDLFGKSLFVLFCFVFIVLEASGFPAKVAAMPGDTSARQVRWNTIITETRRYVAFKTIFSLMTGLVIGGLLFWLKVPYAPLWALLAFLFNFIPNIGSLIAMVMPIPLIELDDLGEDEWSSPGLRKLIAIGGPAFVQLYVGNVLEPAVFGKSLNVTAISVLVALVLWGSIWGLQGAVLSVPLHAATNPAGTRVLVDAVTHSTLRGRHRSRLGLVNLERLGLGWPSQSPERPGD